MVGKWKNDGQDIWYVFSCVVMYNEKEGEKFKFLLAANVLYFPLRHQEINLTGLLWTFYVPLCFDNNVCNILAF